MLTNKIVSADEAAAVIRDGDTVSSSGFVGIGTPDELILALSGAISKPGNPLTHPGLCGGSGRRQGARAHNRLAHPGLLKRVVGGHWSLIPKIGELARQRDRGLQPAARHPRLYREIAARGPGILSKVGLRTFVDPRLGGGKLNGITTRISSN